MSSCFVVYLSVHSFQAFFSSSLFFSFFFTASEPLHLAEVEWSQWACLRYGRLQRGGLVLGLLRCWRGVVEFVLVQMFISVGASL